MGTSNSDKRAPLVRRFSELRRSDVASVGGKNASLGEMINTLGEAGIEVPAGFAATADDTGNMTPEAVVVVGATARCCSREVPQRRMA